MKPNFDISLPSIPGKTIKFKIQDIKQTAFGSQKCRFIDNKKILTKKFIESFNNFHESKNEINLQQQTQASQSGSRVSVNIKAPTISPLQEHHRFRHIIADTKKHMIPLYSQYRDYQTPILNQNKFDKGHTFTKAPKQSLSLKDNQLDQQNRNYIKQANQQQNPLLSQQITDNYYFSDAVKTVNDKRTYQSALNKAKQEKKRQKPTAAFKNITRQKHWDQLYTSQVPGPGFYSIKEQQIKQRPARAVSLKQAPLPDKLKSIITSIVGEQRKGNQQDDQDETSKNKPERMQFMFVRDDRDRFGDQKYPIGFRLNVPGPGAYDVMQGIEEQSKKVALVEEQRKLLKEWFNN